MNFPTVGVILCLIKLITLSSLLKLVFDKLSNASVYPLLYIDEYDVLASHSAAVGKVNDEHMYYLCSRGLNEEQAREFITMGYLIPVLDYFLDQDIKIKAQKTLERRVSNV